MGAEGEAFCWGKGWVEGRDGGEYEWDDGSVRRWSGNGCEERRGVRCGWDRRVVVGGRW